MTFLDAAPATATAGLQRADDDFETTTGELVGIGFQSEALDRNYWDARGRRHETRKFTVMGDISEALYGDRRAWEGQTGEGTPDVDGQISTLFKDLEARRGVDPGRLANFPESFADLDAKALEQVQTEMREERAELDARTANRSRPSALGAAAEFVGMAGAAVSDIEGLVTLPFGAGSGSLGRTMLIEGALGAGSEALAIPAYNAQARFLDRDAPDPLQLLLFGATFGATLPLAGRSIKEGAGLAAKGAKVTNSQLLKGARKLGLTRKQRGAATALAREEAALDSAPAGISPDRHATDLDATATALESGAPVLVRPEDIDGGADGLPIADRLMSDLQAELGLTPDQAAGIVGNLAHESGGFKSLQEIAPLVPGSRGGFGYAQWTGPRRRDFERWSQDQGLDPRSYKANIGFLLHELRNTPEGAVLERLKGAKNAAEATQIFSETFLRPGIPHMASRLDWAQRALGGDIGTVQGPLRSRDGLEATFDAVRLKADDEGFEIEVGEISFTQKWAQPEPAFDPATAALRVSDGLIADQAGRQSPEALQRTADIEAARTERTAIEARIAELRAELKSTNGQAAQSRVRDEIKKADSSLQDVTNRLDTLLDTENRAPEIEIEGEIEDLRAELQETQGKSAKAKVRQKIRAAEKRLDDAQTSRAENRPAPEVNAPRRAVGSAAGRRNNVGSAAEPQANQPPERFAAPEQQLFDDPVMSPGVVAQAEIGLAELRARLAEGPQNDLNMALGGEDAGTTKLSTIINDIEEQDDFLEDLNICMPKGVSNG